MEKNDRIALYEQVYAADYGFEAVMVAARQRLVLEMLQRFKPRVVLEVGCGMELLARRAASAGVSVDQWLIVEPSERFATAAEASGIANMRLEVLRGFLEESTAAVRQRCPRPPDFVICAGLLNEVEDPGAVLRAARDLLVANGVVHVSVPNAMSLHRRLARAMGMIESEKQLTERNRKLAQYRVFDFSELLEVSSRAGLRAVEQGGYFFKPFTHAQMASLGFLSTQVLDGLWRLGREMPELASEIYVNLEAA
jgi:2-polyprenyl-3-methyl-5-hydroxy-6-metoxy-1,4-benzoquinol methylase